MIDYQDALRIVIDAACAARRPVSMPLGECAGGVLAQPLAAKVDSPRFDNSAVDGYAVAGRGRRHRIVGESHAGKAWDGTLEPGSAVRILTGAPVPRGAYAVVMQEDALVEGTALDLSHEPRAGENIRRRGEEYAIGAHLLPSGTTATPPVVSLLAANGLSEAWVFRKPKVAIVTTGDELATPGEALGADSIYESNSYGLAAAVSELGHSYPKLLRAGDELEQTCETLAEALAGADVVLTSGGVSVGSRDHVREALAALGVRERFWKVAIKPGMPMYLGVGPGDKMVFGLPGNPVSCLVNFHLFVRPALRAMAGLPEEPPAFARLARPLKKKAGRLEFVRSVLSGGIATPIEARGSHMLGGLATANALIHFPADSEALEEGQEVEVTVLRWHP